VDCTTAAVAAAAAGRAVAALHICAVASESRSTCTTHDIHSRRLHLLLSGLLQRLSHLLWHHTPAPLQVFVDEVSCIGCGKCVRACPAAFLIEESKYGRARVIPGERSNSLCPGGLCGFAAGLLALCAMRESDVMNLCGSGGAGACRSVVLC
jgi:ferredoxin